MTDEETLSETIHTETIHDNQRESDGRSILIETHAYTIQVWGDPNDTLEDLMEYATSAADRAKEDAIELDVRFESDDKHYS